MPAPPLALPFIQLFAAWALLSIEEIGHIIEEPFNMPFASTPGYPRTTLSMEATADAVVRDVVAAMPELGAEPCARDQLGCEVADD